MKLIFVRHGHTNFNRFGIMNDDPSVDVHLTVLGKKQASNAATVLKDEKIDAIFASMLPRTLETAQIINKFHNLEIHRDKRINDNRTGYNGLPWVVRWLTFKLAKHPFTKRFRDGESLEDSKNRVFEFLDELKATYPDKTVLVIGHANTGWIINGYANDLPLEKMFHGHITNGHPVKYEL